MFKQEGYDPKIVIVREQGSLQLKIIITPRPLGGNKESGCSDNAKTLRIIGAAYGLADVTYVVH